MRGGTGSAAAQRAEAAAQDGERLLRLGGGPQDVARYECGCGTGFTAAVGTSVTCPGCGALQDW